jgi:predicted phage-related endonuclease
MKIHDVVQGSPDWLALRARHLCASDAPAMMGESNRTKRTDLVRMKATGDAKVFSAWAQENLLNRGHATENDSREFAQSIIGDELFPVTASDDGERFLASFDGITMAEDIGYEHKLWNEELAAAVRAQSHDLPGGHHWQLEQQLMVSGAMHILFVVSDGTPDRRVWMEYQPVPGRRDKLIAGWKQFEEDVKNYVHVEPAAPVVGTVVRDLPAIRLQVEGKVIAANLADYREIALAFIANINTELKTDQDFADAEQNLKACEKAETQLENAKTQALSQTADIDAMFRMLNEVKEAMRQKRLALSKLVDARKAAIRSEILQEGQANFDAHIAGLNKRVNNYMPMIARDFAGAMKNKRTIDSLRDAVNTELARAKIAANEVADRIDANLKALAAACTPVDYRFLFSDLQVVVVKAPDDFAMLVKSRVSDHKQAEDKRLADERERIRKEEEAKAAASIPAAAPSPVATPAPQPVPLARGKRPADAEIVALVARHWNVSQERATQWLLDLNLKPAKKKAA